MKRCDDGQAPEGQPPHAVIEITDSGVYVRPINIRLRRITRLQIRQPHAHAAGDPPAGLADRPARINSVVSGGDRQPLHARRPADHRSGRPDRGRAGQRHRSPFDAGARLVACIPIASPAGRPSRAWS